MTTAPSTGRFSGHVRRVLGDVSRDLLAVGGATLLATAVLPAPGTAGHPVRVIAGTAFVLLAPGYALVAAAFPARPRDGAAHGPGHGERAALALGASLALLPPVGLVHAFAGRPFETGPLVGTLAATVLLLSGVAAVRRFALSPAERYRAPSVLVATAGARAWLSRSDRVDTVLSGLLTLAVLVAVGSLVYGVAAPQQAGAYTGVTVLATDGDGSLAASNYPTNLTAGEERDLTLRVENARDAAVEYAVVVELQRVTRPAPGNLTVTDRERLAGTTLTVGAGETRFWRHGIAPTTTGDGLRLTYYVYRGSVPAVPRTGTAARTTHLWVNVGSSGASVGTSST